MNIQSKNLKVAIVHDWLYGGGAERVVYELHQMFPDAPIYTSYCSDDWRQKLDNKVVTGFLQHWPFSRLRKFLPVLRIWWFTHLDLSDFDLVISSSGNGEAKGIKLPANTLHICYCHAPTHFYWRHYEHYLRNPGFGWLNPLARLGLRLLVGPLRRWDLKAARRPDFMIANSTHTQSEIKQFYGRDSIVIHPPVDIERFANQNNSRQPGFVTAGRQTPYKRNDLIINACNRLRLRLTVLGKGPEHAKLLHLAGSTVNLIEKVSDEEMAQALGNHQAFIFAAYEDFGITPIEAIAAGTPVIAYRAGGALDYVKPGLTGLFFEEQTVESLTQALQNFKPEDYNPVALQNFAKQFAPQVFRQKFLDFIASKVKK